MASFTPNPWFSPYIGTHFTMNGFRSEHPLPEGEFFASALPHNGPADLQEEFAFPTPARSTGIPPGSNAVLVPRLIGLDRNNNRSLDAMETLYPMWPSDNQSIPGGQIPCRSDSHTLTPSFHLPGSFDSIFDPHGYLLSFRDMWREAPISYQNPFASRLNAHVPFSESIFPGLSAQTGVVSDNDEQQTIGVGFDTQNLPLAQYQPSFSPTTDLQPNSGDIHFCPMRAPHDRFHDLIQPSGNSDLTFDGALVDVLPQAYQGNEPSGLTSPESCHSPAVKRRPPQSKLVETASPSKRLKMEPGFRPIVSKSTVSRAESNEDVSSDSTKPTDPRKGRRTGPLTPEGRKNASKARKEGACAPCRRSHIRCDLIRPVCGNCEKKYNRHTLRFACNVGPLKDYTGAFIPVVFTADLNDCAVEKWIKEKQIVFTAHTMKISVSLDPFKDAMMSLPVHEIYSNDQGYLQIPILTAKTRKNERLFPTRPSLQYGIYNRSREYLQQIYKEYIEKVSSCSIGAAESIPGDTPRIIWKVLGAIQRFEKAKSQVTKNSLISKALNVFWMHYLMSRSLVLSDDSAREAIESLQNSTAVLPPEPFVSASLVSRQMKVVMKHSLEDALQDLFIGLDKKLKDDSKPWAVCFCAILILCVLVEQVHAATDAFVADKTSRDDKDAAQIRKDGIKACQDIEAPINYSWEYFRIIQGKHSPVKDGRPISPHKQEEELIKEIQEILTDYRDDISERAEATCQGGFSDTPTDHDKFYEKISSQYVCKFLAFFCY